MELILALKQNFVNQHGIKIYPAKLKDIEVFQQKYNVLIPEDLLNYYNVINGTGNYPLNNLYEFYGIQQTQTLKREFKDWYGIPDYKKLDFNNFENVFIFGNFMINTYTFGIELHKSFSSKNKVLIFCGGEHKIIADNFNEFLNLYLNAPDKIYI